MIHMNIKAVNMELTDAIREYAEKRVGSLEKFLSRYGDSVMYEVEIGKSTMHHKTGDVFKAEVLISGIPKHIRAVSEKEDLYAAIDDVRDEAERQLVGMKDRRDTIFRRGARSVKKMLKGLSKRNPFTSKVD